MAATKTANNGQLVLVYEAGVDAKNNPIFKTKSYKGLDTEATPDQILAVGNAIASLQQYS
ncbi:MAG: DUF1659 domain-containing protein, partial [Bacillaceae bacterium]